MREDKMTKNQQVSTKTTSFKNKLDLIGIVGRRGTGKDTAGDVLRGFLSYHTKAFADPLRKACMSLYGVSEGELTDRVLKETPLLTYPYKSPRELMQITGTDMIRTHFPDFWLHKMRETLKIVNMFDFKACVTDVRFPNEVALIRELGGCILKIERPSLNNIDAADFHSSERYVDNIVGDFTIVNDSDEETFKTKVRATIEGLNI